MQKHSMASIWKASLFQAAHQRQLSLYLSKHYSALLLPSPVDLTTTRGMSYQQKHEGKQAAESKEEAESNTTDSNTIFFRGSRRKSGEV